MDHIPNIMITHVISLLNSIPEGYVRNIYHLFILEKLLERFATLEDSKT